MIRTNQPPYFFMLYLAVLSVDFAWGRGDEKAAPGPQQRLGRPGAARLADQSPSASPFSSIGVPATEGPKFPETGIFNLEARERLRARIDHLIPQLADPEQGRRDQAERELREIAAPARAAVERAIDNPHPEIARRSQAILATFPPFTHEIVDADGEPIPYARVILTMSVIPRLTSSAPTGEPTETAELRKLIEWSDEFGRVSIPSASDGVVQGTAQIHHSEYGWGQCRFDMRINQRMFRLPLARKGSLLRDRSVQGIVLGPDGEPVPGVVISCSSVRTPGEGLINGSFPHGESLTDQTGHFSYYLPNENRNQARGDLIPENSRFDLLFSPTDPETCFPMVMMASNQQPVQINLSRPDERHRFRFEKSAGGWLDQPQDLLNLHVELKSAGQRSIPLDSASLVKGRRILNGRYSAVFYDNGKVIRFEEIVVETGSPEELLFRLPKPIVYRGRVIQGVTQQGVPDAIVIGWRSTARQNLALLTDDEWNTIEATPSNPPADHPTWKLLGKHYGVEGLVRTDQEGRFEIVKRPDQEFYGLMAFDRQSIPFKVRLGSLQPNAEHVIEVNDFPLYRAARVLVHPVFENNRVSLAPEWLPAAEGQPPWFAGMQSFKQGSDREFEYIHWMALNESQPIFVPAEVRLRLRFHAPYNDEWAPAITETPLQLMPADIVDLGELQFAASLSAQVQIADSAGNPLEGVAVRRKYDTENSWSVAHNSDETGTAFFFVHPNSKGTFRVTDIRGPIERDPAKNVSIDFQVGKMNPAQPFRITLTDTQVAAIRQTK